MLSLPMGKTDNFVTAKLEQTLPYRLEFAVFPSLIFKASYKIERNILVNIYIRESISETYFYTRSHFRCTLVLICSQKDIAQSCADVFYNIHSTEHR